jgi:hypothetical protein
MGCPNNGYLEPNLDAATSQELQAYLEGDLESIAMRRFGYVSKTSLENSDKLREYARVKLSELEEKAPEKKTEKKKKLNKIYDELPDIANW